MRGFDYSNDRKKSTPKKPGHAPKNQDAARDGKNAPPLRQIIFSRQWHIFRKQTRHNQDERGDPLWPRNFWRDEGLLAGRAFDHLAGQVHWRFDVLLTMLAGNFECFHFGLHKSFLASFPLFGTITGVNAKVAFIHLP